MQGIVPSCSTDVSAAFSSDLLNATVTASMSSCTQAMIWSGGLGMRAQ
jgi:hypothetical protein